MNLGNWPEKCKCGCNQMIPITDSAITEFSITGKQPEYLPKHSPKQQADNKWHHTAESKEKMSKSHTGQKLSIFQRIAKLKSTTQPSYTISYDEFIQMAVTGLNQSVEEIQDRINKFLQMLYKDLL